MFFKVLLTQHQLSNAKEFLSRVDMKGNEAIAYVDLIRVLNNAIPVPEPGGELNEPSKEDTT